jgi:hypothetical protein
MSSGYEVLVGLVKPNNKRYMSKDDPLKPVSPFSELRKYFEQKQNRSDIRVRELIEIIGTYLSLARMRDENFYENFIEEIKSFRAPMSKKNWELIVDHAILKNLYDA